jgi:hypothetical protein
MDGWTNPRFQMGHVGNQHAKFSQIRVIKNTGCLTLEGIQRPGWHGWRSSQTPVCVEFNSLSNALFYVSLNKTLYLLLRNSMNGSASHNIQGNLYSWLLMLQKLGLTLTALTPLTLLDKKILVFVIKVYQRSLLALYHYRHLLLSVHRIWINNKNHKLTHESPVRNESLTWNTPNPILSTAWSTVNTSGMKKSEPSVNR